jgi:mannose-6-phosphate isomerase-like protein (cupin superfamily)
MGPRKWQRENLTTYDDGPSGRWLTEPNPSGWTDPVISEWELSAQSWTDHHVHDEYAYVLEGQLFVECDGVTVEVNKGEMVCVPGGTTGRYLAPAYARMLGIYAANPKGEATTKTAFEPLR